jgi:hypothetical protein
VWGTEQKTPQQVQYLVYGAENPPYQFSNPQLKELGLATVGIVCRLAEEIAREAGFQILSLEEPARRLKRSIASKRYQRWISYGQRAWENDPAWQDHHFSKINLFSFQPGVVTRADRRLEIRSLDDVADKVVVLIRGFDYGPVLSQLQKLGTRLEYAEDSYDALSMLEMGRADVYLEDLRRARFVARARQLEASMAADNAFNFAVLALPAREVAMVMSGDMPSEYVMAMNRALERLESDGRLQQIVNSY